MKEITKNKNRIWNSLLILFGAFLILSNSCKKMEEDIEIPSAMHISVSNITQTSASCEGIIGYDGGSPVTVRGVCWSTSQIPTIDDSKTNDGIGAGDFTSVITGLTPYTNYYVRAYATNNAGTGYGTPILFTTLQGSSGATITDIDGNVYNTITIGTQVWMVENLKTTKFRDGTSIPNVSDNAAWQALTTGALSYYNNDSIANASVYGTLYNWYATTDVHNICPEGWHIPTDTELTTLITYLGGENDAGSKLKETGTTHWTSPNTGAINGSGFSALPGGYRSNNGTFHDIKLNGYMWSASEYDAANAWFLGLYYNFTNAYRDYDQKTIGISVRCLKD